jgi:hypothetical protein
MANREELIEKLKRNARFYQSEGEAMRPQDARHLGPNEAVTIAELLNEAAAELEGGHHERSST